jgi:hypothetical protein
LYADRSSKDEQLIIRSFVRKTKNTNVEGGLELKLTIGNSGTVALRQLKFYRVKGHGHTYKFYLNH